MKLSFCLSKQALTNPANTITKGQIKISKHTNRRFFGHRNASHNTQSGLLKIDYFIFTYLMVINGNVILCKLAVCICHNTDITSQVYHTINVKIEERKQF